MADLGVHLEQKVFPEAPVRQWVCSMPWSIRAVLGFDRKLCADVVSAFIGEASRSLLLEPEDLLSWLCAPIPPPRFPHGAVLRRALVSCFAPSRGGAERERRSAS